MHLPHGLSLAQLPCKTSLWELWPHWSQNRLFIIASLISIEVTAANSPHSQREEGSSNSTSRGGEEGVVGCSIHPGAGCQGWAGCKMPSTSVPPFNAGTQAYLALHKHKERNNPGIFSSAGEASHCQKQEPKLNLPAQSHLQKLWVPYCICGCTLHHRPMVIQHGSVGAGDNCWHQGIRSTN